jgi:hypothetical protein
VVEAAAVAARLNSASCEFLDRLQETRPSQQTLSVSDRVCSLAAFLLAPLDSHRSFPGEWGAWKFIVGMSSSIAKLGRIGG